jgi:YXWGXW repeat-containing protein
MMKRAILAAITTAGLLCIAVFCTGAYAQVSINVEIGVPPPPPVYEVVPAPRPGYVWAPGYWGWDAPGHKHAWKKGHWVRDRPGYVYTPPQWQQAPQGWVFVPERWEGRGKPGKGKKDTGYVHCPPGHAKKGEC